MESPDRRTERRKFGRLRLVGFPATGNVFGDGFAVRLEDFFPVQGPLGRAFVLGVLGVFAVSSGCGGSRTRLPSGSGDTVATIRVVRPVVQVRDSDSRVRTARSGERITAGAMILSGPGPVWVEHDLGGSILLDRSSRLKVTERGVVLKKGRAWVEVPSGFDMLCRVGDIVLDSDGAAFELALGPASSASAYLLKGRAWYRRAGMDVGGGALLPGKRVVKRGGRVLVEPVLAWDDWTGGLAWQGESAGLSSAALGELGARRPGDYGKARFPLALRSLKVRAAVRKDLIVVRMEQKFFNPASETLEGIYRLHLPKGAMLQSFGVDRDGKVVFGYIKERERARAQYQAQVYEGSKENPALLEWDAPGLYKARIYPIRPGTTRTLVVIYTQWIDRANGQRRWRFPLGAAGAAGLRIGELDLQVNLAEAGARRVGCSSGCRVDRGRAVLRRSDYLPHSDFVLTLPATTEHQLFVQAKQGKDGRYFLARVPVIDDTVLAKPRSLDLAVVLDVSGGTDPGRLLVARTVVEGLLRQLGPNDRVAVFGADLALRPVSKGLVPASKANIDRLLEKIGAVKVGGATDLGAVMTQAGSLFEKGRTGAVVYLGDAMPTVGDMDVAALRDRIARLPVPLRLYGVAVGGRANLDLLAGLVGGAGLALRVVDPSQAGRAALRIVSHMSRPAAFKVTADLGPRAERVYPRRPVEVVAGRCLPVVGRVRGSVPKEIVVRGILEGKTFEKKLRLSVQSMDDAGDLERRWAASRLAQLLAGGAGREEMVELGTRFGLITPYTSFYVPSSSELAHGESVEKVKAAGKRAARLAAFLASAERKRKAGAGGETSVKRGKARLTSRSNETTRQSGETESMSAPLVKSKSIQALRDKVVPSPSAAPGFGGLQSGSGGGHAAAERSAKGRNNRLARPRFASRKMFHRRHRIGRGRVGRPESAWKKGVRRASPELSARPSVADSALDAAEPGVVGRGLGGKRGRNAGLVTGRTRSRRKMRPLVHGPGAASKLDAARVTSGVGVLEMDRSSSAVDVHLRIDIRDHRPSNCSAASMKPLSVRSRLWRERLSSKRGLRGVFEVWYDARDHCELRTWQARRRLLSAMLDRLGSVRNMLRLARRFRRSFGTYRFLQKAILGRLRRPSDLRLVMQAFGLGATGSLAMAKELVARLGDPKLKVAALKNLLLEQPGNWGLRSLLVSLLEETGQWKAALGMVSLVEGNPYADPDFRIQLAEVLIRHSEASQAKRLLSELVEFRPRDAALRRRLGDLYRAYGWYDDAYREYKTLASFRPSETSVLLLMAQAAAGAGRIDEALRLERRVAGTADPGSVQGVARYALLWTSLRLMKLRIKARQAGDKGLEKLASLLTATRRSGVLRWAKPVRIVLTWSHPSADTGLYVGVGNYRVSRAPILGTLYGIEAFEGTHPDREAYKVVVRRPEGARAKVVEAELAVMWNEGKKDEQLWTRSLRFDAKHHSYEFVVRGGRIEEVTR